ncbi:NACHT domain-containing protein [Mycobacteroides chelonae]|uniref:NACHT domain-containing protein n=1 Tax=Mycobacteroides chelonae TaxID=1774 RepID=UPI0018B01FF7|nr:NACHT domain-containing protein [Mycobacteroides chelonae]
MTTKPDRLPIHELSWQNAERLFLRLLETQGQVQWAKLYGAAGQDQDGIDAYARLSDPVEGTAGSSQGSLHARPYVVLQSRRVKTLYPSGITGAVSEFLAGDWPKQTGTFYYATSADLTESRLDDALRESADRLGTVGIKFVPWGVFEVSELLRAIPCLVDDFFGRAWVEHFCGSAALATLKPRLTFEEVRTLRGRLFSLYSAVFDSQAALRRPDIAIDGVRIDRPADAPFTMLDVVPQQPAAIGNSSFGDRQHTGVTPTQSPSQGEFLGNHPDSQDVSARTSSEAGLIRPGGGDRVVNSSRLGTPRRCLRSVRDLLATAQVTPHTDDTFRHQADAWLAQGDRHLLIGDPGSGKSSLLRFVALDLLKETPQSVLLQQKHGGRLPVWLPFGFLCRHLDDSQGNSLVSGIRTWLQSRSADDLVPLVERALEDDRLLLLIDGLDEWTSRDAANVALDAIETFLGRTAAAALLSSRPYAVSRLVSALTWGRANICDLTDTQRQQIAGKYLAPPGPVHRIRESGTVTESEFGASVDEVEEQSIRLVSASNPYVDPFIDQVSAVPALSALSRVPLFLALLATTWQGEPLPAKRYDLFASIIDLLIRRHPQMRRRASRVGDLPVTDRDFRLAIEAVAYQLRIEGCLGPVPTSHVRKLLRDAFADEEIGGYPLSDARQKADAAMQLAEGEFGLLVDQGADHVGFIHRVVLDQLAGQHLARLTQREQIQVLIERHGDPSWLDVLLASLAGQPNPPAVAAFIDAVLDDDQGPSQGWPWNSRREESSHEFLAAALAAGVDVSPRKFQAYVDMLTERVDSYVSLEHRAALVASLARVYSHTGHGHRLAGTFKRWLDATRPYPAAALYQLRDLAIDDSTASSLLLRGMRSDHEETRINAAVAYAHRFGADYNPDLIGSQVREAQVDVSLSEAMFDSLVTALRRGPTSEFQSAALVAMGCGWLSSEVTQEHLRWARAQPIALMRTVALFLTFKANTGVPLSSFFDSVEIDWLLSQIRRETHILGDFGSRMMYELTAEVVAELEPAQRYAVATFALDTLSKNGSNGGHRDICWRLACTALADDERLRDWVISEFRGDKEPPLILYNLALMPPAWLENAEMQAAVASRPPEVEYWNAELHLNVSPHFPREHVRARLLKALDSHRPWGIASRLLRDFGEDADVHKELLSRVQDDNVGGRFSPIAVELMGIEGGFERLYSMLVAANLGGGEIEMQDHVLLAQCVAEAWANIRDCSVADADSDAGGMFSNADSDIDHPSSRAAEQAIRVMASYSDEDVCAACIAAPTNTFSWHIPAIIRTWPERVVDYALRELADNRHVSRGLTDEIHAAALRAYAGKTFDGAAAVIETALDMMAFLEAELREVLVHELSTVGVDSAALIDLLSHFRTDPDDTVRRTAIVGITRALSAGADSAAQSVSGNADSLLTDWCQYVRQQLCAYGPALEEDRQNAWVAMLMMRNFSLIDGVMETIGAATPPGVRLTDGFSSPDDLLVNLIVANWDALEDHFGDQLLPRLSGSREERSDTRVVLSTIRNLAVAADRNPRVSQLVRSFQLAGAGDLDELSSVAKLSAVADITDDKFLRELDGLTSSPELIEWTARQGASGADIVRLLLHVGEAGAGGPRRRRSSDKWAVDRLLDHAWHRLENEELREILSTSRFQDRWHDDSPWSQPFGVLERAVWALLYPESDEALRWMDGLAKWFNNQRQGDGPVTWLEICAVAFGVSPAADLPALVGRLFNPDRLQYMYETHWEITTPLAHRLRSDPDAVDALRESLVGGPVPVASPFFSGSIRIRRQGGPDPSDAELDDRTTQGDVLARRIWAAMIALSYTGHLRPADRDAALEVLRRGDTRSIVHNPYLDQSGPLWAACLPLLRPANQ